MSENLLAREIRDGIELIWFCREGLNWGGGGE